MKTLYPIICMLLLSFTSLADVNDPNEVFERCEYTASNGCSIGYRLLMPTEESVKKSETGKFPLVVFMHGSGERGDDNESQLANGGALFADPDNRSKYPAFVIFPQCPSDLFWALPRMPRSQKEMMGTGEEMPIMAAVDELVKKYVRELPVDPDRVYIIGLSMGGMAVYDAVTRHPENYAVAVPICGAIDPGRLKDTRDVAFRIYHGSEDEIVPVEAAIEAFKALMGIGAEAQLIEFTDDGHDSWTDAFASPDFLSWIFAHDKRTIRKARFPIDLEAYY